VLTKPFGFADTTFPRADVGTKADEPNTLGDWRKGLGRKRFSREKGVKGVWATIWLPNIFAAASPVPGEAPGVCLPKSFCLFKSDCVMGKLGVVGKGVLERLDQQSLKQSPLRGLIGLAQKDLKDLFLERFENLWRVRR
jgi:hypothetical protein